MRGKKTFTITREDHYVIIRDIQVDVCSGCGEAYYGVEQGRAIEEIPKTLDDQGKRLQAPCPIHENRKFAWCLHSVFK